MKTIFDCAIIPMDKFVNSQGKLTEIKSEDSIPFPINRVIYMYGVPDGVSRGAHAHKQGYQLVIAAGGSFDILLDDGKNKKIVRLSQPNYGLLVVPGIWRDLSDFSSGAVCLVLASHTYKDTSTITDYEEFKQFKNM